MWADAGIEGRPHFKALLYNEPAQTLVAHFERRAGPQHFVGESYTRTLDGERYRKVPGTTDLISYSSPVSAASAPFIFFNVLEHVAEDPAGANWGGLRCLDLISGQLTVVSEAGRIPVPDGYARFWVSSLLSVDSSGERLLCSVGFEPQTDGMATHIDYWLCELLVRNPVPRRLNRLRNTFF